MSATPVIRPSLCSCAIDSTRLSGFTWYGSWETTRMVRPLASSSVSTTARIRIEPRPVRYASEMPSLPTISAPVGKSGPVIRSIAASSSSSGPASGCSRYQITAEAISRRLCGGMFVAMPTAIPEEPLTSKFGMRAGSTVGSVVLLS